VGQPGRKVLIVDDDEDIANLVEEALSEDGYAVTILREAESGAIDEAVALHQPDCILLDGGAGSGYGDSWESAASMSRRTPPVPVIMFTAHGGAVAEAKANESSRSQAAGLTAVLTKPFDLYELLRVVEHAANEHEARRGAEPLP
jgi:CheY-like chemotaxis protein